jgi:hypothetical protein
MTPDGRLRGRNRYLPFASASLTKTMLLVAALRRAADRPLNAREQALLAPMITRSDNDAARAVYATLGDGALYAVARAARMRAFSVHGALFEAQITAADQARLFLRVDRLVPARHRAYARGLLTGIVAGQRWGIAPVAAARGLEIAFKGGWRKGLTHQAALLERGGRRVALAVLTRGAAPFAYREATIAGIAQRLLAPR